MEKYRSKSFCLILYEEDETHRKPHKNDLTTLQNGTIHEEGEARSLIVVLAESLSLLCPLRKVFSA